MSQHSLQYWNPTVALKVHWSLSEDVVGTAVGRHPTLGWKQVQLKDAVRNEILECNAG